MPWFCIFCKSTLALFHFLLILANSMVPWLPGAVKPFHMGLGLG